MEKQVKIQSGLSLSKLLKQIVNESVDNAKLARKNEGVKADLYHNAVEEKERQNAVSNIDEEDDDLFGDADEKSNKGSDSESNNSSSDKNDEKEPAPAPSKTIDDETEKLSNGNIKSTDIVDKLNTIRSGKSFKDSTISSKLAEYVDSLSKAEKVALLAFLKGIAQIVTGEFEAKQAVEPSKDPSDIKMQKGDKHQTKSIKPNIIKTPEKDKKKGSSAEDTTAPTPITPVKK